jgi:hypothetical protein
LWQTLVLSRMKRVGRVNPETLMALPKVGSHCCSSVRPRARPSVRPSGLSIGPLPKVRLRWQQQQCGGASSARPNERRWVVLACPKPRTAASYVVTNAVINKRPIECRKLDQVRRARAPLGCWLTVVTDSGD